MRILIAIDGSDDSRHAVEETARRPCGGNSEILIIHAVQSPIPVLPDTMGVGAEFARAVFDEAAAHGTEIIKAAADKIRQGGADKSSIATSIVAMPYDQSVAQTIVDEAERFDADLIVMGSRGRSAWKRLLMGSVSMAVAQHAHCSVEIARSRPGRTDDEK